MRLQGKIANWNDDKGFGFVRPSGGGDRAFVHIKAFTPRSRRPVDGDVITYALVRELNNRYKADNIKFARTNKNTKKANQTNSHHTFGSIFTLFFCITLVGSILTSKLSPIVAGLYLFMSLVAFIAYAKDKSAAQNGRWRTPESSLHIFSLLGGWPGAYYAQNKLRHKSRKIKFKRIYWLTVILNLTGLFWLHTDTATRFLNQVIFPLIND